MNFKRVIAGLAVTVTFATTGAFAIAQTQSNEDNSRAAKLGLDPSREYPESFLNTAEKHDEMAPDDSEPGPLIAEDEVHIPKGSVPEVFVKDCTQSALKDPSLDGDPLCRAVLLADAGEVEPGIHKVAEVKQRYEATLGGE